MQQLLDRYRAGLGLACGATRSSRRPSSDSTTLTSRSLARAAAQSATRTSKPYAPPLSAAIRCGSVNRGPVPTAKPRMRTSSSVRTASLRRTVWA